MEKSNFIHGTTYDKHKIGGVNFVEQWINTATFLGAVIAVLFYVFVVLVAVVAASARSQEQSSLLFISLVHFASTHLFLSIITSFSVLLRRSV